MTNTNNTPNYQAIADTTIAQLGRGALAMLGCPGATYNKQTTMICIKGNRKINWIYITLKENDTYTVEFRKVAGGRFNNNTGVSSPITNKVICDSDFIHAPDLKSLIESTTGLYLSL